MSIPLIKKILIKSISLVSIILPWHINPAMADETEIKTGDPAPAFTLYDQHNKQRSITDYQGKWLIIYFYPKDDTPGCTQEACHFRDDIYKIRELNAEVIGISIDNILSHKAFSEKFNLPFPLLADPNGITARQYGAFFSLGPVKFAK
ncbi:MAG: peroxiredoxin, partial [Gammaproteobacteria bacterium]|nr:peroxiredoxin [Gammaproteobacteria bacterium]